MSIVASAACDPSPEVTYTVVHSDWQGTWVAFESSENSDEGVRMVCAR